ncbi:MAG: S-layer protein, partial [Planctomycetaceae bacterium]|nr:S-layer protein [Planctomycetaceae bacterium]
MFPAKQISPFILLFFFTGIVGSSLHTARLSAAETAEKIVLLPETIQLSGKEARHGVSVQKMNHDNEYAGPVTTETQLSSSNPAVVKIEGQTVVPVGNGTAIITATLGKLKSSSKVTVTGIDKPHQWSFRNDVQPVLTKAACNSGPCHGALAGKGGFRLSLKAYDVLGDFHTIVKQSRGRRIELSDPARSLFLIKPTGAVPHKGGVR